MSNILLKIKKHGRVSKKVPVEKFLGTFKLIKEVGNQKSVIELTSEGIIIINAKTGMLKKIPFSKVQKIVENQNLGVRWTTFSFHNGSKIHVSFFSTFMGAIFKDELHYEFLHKVIEVFSNYRKKLAKIKQGEEEARLKEDYNANYELFKSKILEYIEPYYDITFLDVAIHFKIREEDVERDMKEMLEAGIIKGRLHSDGITLRDSVVKLDPLGALKMKLVNGEITEEEYVKKKKLLES